MTLKSLALKEFGYAAYQKIDGFSINVFAIDKGETVQTMWIQDESLTNSTFSIVGLPVGPPMNCYGDRSDGLVPVTCRGQIVFK